MRSYTASWIRSSTLHSPESCERLKDHSLDSGESCYLARPSRNLTITRPVDVSNGQVAFRYKDYADSSAQKVMTLSAMEFLRRFTQHVLPRGLVKIRHYGLLANRTRAAKLNVCRFLLRPEGKRDAFAEQRLPKAFIGPAEAPRCGR